MYIEDDSENLLLTYPKFIDRKQKKVTMFYKKKKMIPFKLLQLLNVYLLFRKI